MSNDDFLAGNATHPSAKFTDIGDKVSGVVTGIRKLEDRDPSGEVKTWQDGKPKFVWVFTLDTPSGTMSLWARGNMVTAIREAARAVGVTAMDGATLAVQFIEYGEARKGMNAPKIYKAQMKPAQTAKISVDDLI